MSSDQQPLTRLTTVEERVNIVGVVLDQGDVDHFMGLLAKGLVTAAAQHEAAVQNDMALSVETSVRISRPAFDDSGEVVEVVGREVVTGRVRARKVYADPAKAPQTD